MSLILSLVLACAPPSTELGSEAEAVASTTVAPSKNAEAPAPAEGRWLADLDNTDALLVDAPEGEWTEMAEVDGILLAGRYSVSGGYELVELAQGPVDDVLDYTDADRGLIELRATPSEGELRPPTGLDARIEKFVAREHVGALLGEDGTTYHTLLAGAIDTETAVPPSSVWVDKYGVSLAQGKSLSWTYYDNNLVAAGAIPDSGDPDVYLDTRTWWTWEPWCVSALAAGEADYCGVSSGVDFDARITFYGYSDASFNMWFYASL